MTVHEKYKVKTRDIITKNIKHEIGEYGEYGIWEHKKLPAPKMRINNRICAIQYSETVSLFIFFRLKEKPHNEL